MYVDWNHVAPARDKMRAAVKIINPEDEGTMFFRNVGNTNPAA